jgi:hypothetical protein
VGDDLGQKNIAFEEKVLLGWAKNWKQWQWGQKCTVGETMIFTTSLELDMSPVFVLFHISKAVITEVFAVACCCFFVKRPSIVPPKTESAGSFKKHITPVVQHILANGNTNSMKCGVHVASRPRRTRLVARRISVSGHTHTHLHTLTPDWVRDGEGAQPRLHKRTVFVGRERFAVTAAVEATDRNFCERSIHDSNKVARALSSNR